MVRIVCAPFHPDLEEALVAEVHAAKLSDPLRPLAILVPSQVLARRVKWLLAVERQTALLDVHILTFHQLAVTILREDSQKRPPELVNHAFREQLLRSLVSRGLPSLEVFRGWVQMHGIWTGMWATIQDLKEARIDPASALSALEEGLIGGEDGPRLRALLHLYRAVLATDRSLQIADPDDLAHLSIPRVPSSAFLARMHRVVYYGFYDLTQGQLDFFKAVQACYPATVLFPLQRGNSAYQFAQRFFDTYITGLTPALASGTDQPGFSQIPLPFEGEGEAACASTGRPRQIGEDTLLLGSLATEMALEVRGSCRIFSAMGLDDEVSTVAKEILRLIEDQHMEPTDLGVVARTLDPVLPLIRKVFDENRIPYACPLGEPLIHQPLVKTIVQFIGLRAASFPRASVLEVLTSPFLLQTPAGQPAPRPDQWDWITRRLNITKGLFEDGGLGDWRRLQRAAEQGITVPSDEENGPAHVPFSQVQTLLLWQLVRHLHGDLTAVPERAGWKEYAAIFMNLLPRWFALSAWTEDVAMTHDENVQLAVRESMRSVETLDLLDDEISLHEWCDHMIRVLERAKLPSGTQDLAGVRVLDAMAARGFRFRALFVIGLNEKVFPRSIQEDAFLRDADRDILNRDLGYKLARKMDGFAEERLLFALLLRSARERLYLSYQRADQNGRALAPSGYLAELHRELSDQEIAIRRRPMERWLSWPCDPSLLTAQEMALRLILQSGQPLALGLALNGKGDRDGRQDANVRESTLLRCVGLRQAPELLRQGLTLLAGIEGADLRLTGYDGFVGEDSAAGPGQIPFSPTALQRYAQCPFQYYAAQVLRVVPLPRPESVNELEGRERGKLCHAILRVFYERLYGTRSPVSEISPQAAMEWLMEAAESVFAEFERTEATGYPLLWEVAKEEILRLAKELVSSDLVELGKSGYVPSLFEVPVTGALDLGSMSGTPVMIHGVLDRVDLKDAAGKVHVRVVDYKYTGARSMKPRDKNLILATIRAERLQPLLYLELAKHVLPGCLAEPDSAAFYFLGSKWIDMPIRRTALDASCWEGHSGVLIKKTLQRLLEGIRQGRFSILPGDYCGHCDFASACRYTHEPTGRRTRTDPRMKLLRTLRSLKLPRAEPAELPCGLGGDTGETPCA
jgi:ATP-dependent helicase/nuclease subunit B